MRNITAAWNDWDELRRAITNGGPESLDHPALDLAERLQSRMDGLLAENDDLRRQLSACEENQR